MGRRPDYHIARLHFHGVRAFHTSTHELGFLGIKNRIFRIEYISNHSKCFQNASLVGRAPVRFLPELGILRSILDLTTRARISLVACKSSIYVCRRQIRSHDFAVRLATLHQETLFEIILSNKGEPHVKSKQRSMVCAV
jgi:hypothetical protein